MNNRSHSDSIHASLRKLLAIALSNRSSAEPQTITRTVKFKIDTEAHPRLISILNEHFDAFEIFRRKVLDEFESWWNKDPDSFQEMVRCSTKQKYEEKSSCYAWLYTHFLKGAKLSPDLSRDAANSMLDSLSSGLKSFLTRRANVTVEIERRHNQNLREWHSDLSQLAIDHEVSLPSPPPALDFDNLTAVAIEKYNDWVGRTRAWCNLVLVQQKEVSRREACLPRYLKGYPGFPGSQRYATPETLPENLKKLEQAAREQSEKAAARFAKLSPEVWPNIQQRFSPATKTADGQKPRPRTANQTVCRRFAALRAAKPEMAPAQLAEEILAGIFRGTEKLKKHLVANGFEDRRAVIKLANLYNVATAFALEPIRVSGDYILFYAQETPKRNAFGDVRGGLHQPSDESAAIQITGFSVNEDGAPNYNGLLVCRKSAEENDDSWAFLYCHQGGQTFQLADQTAKLRGKSLTEWLGFASRGGSRKKAEASVKQLVRRRVWVSEKTPPSVLPLAFGSRQGREYLWHFDRDLRTKNEWVLGNGRLLRVIPPGRPKAAEFYLTITFERQAPPLADFKAEKFIGVDRGEAVPAAYAVVDKQGKHLASGKIAEVYREQQRQFNEAKRELQRTQGGYTRWLRSKERNRARALGGEVTRAMLALAAEHQAPLVLENLSSSLATRGGKRTMMSQMQYERMLTSLEQKLAEVGLYALPSAPRFRKGDNGYIKLVGPAYTSSTCSACGHVHSSEFYEKLADGLEADGNSIWRITLANGQKRVLPTEYTYWLKAKGEQTKQTHHRIAELLDGKAISKISKSNRNSLVRLLKGSWLPYRPKQAEFQCVVCGHQMNADIQGAINIARKFLFRLESNKKANEMTEAERRKVIGEWESWYKQKLAAVWHV